LTLNQSPTHRRQSRSFRSVALGSAALALVMVAVVASLYFRFIRYERVAARHVPSDAVTAIRLDVEQALVYEPVRRHLVPLLGGPSSSPAEQEARVLRLEARTGIRRGDLREIVVAWGQGETTWVIILGGIFRDAAGMPVLAEALRAESPDWVATPDGVAVVHRGSGVAVGRGRDHTLFVASSEEELRRSLAPGTAYDALGLAPTGAGAAALSEAGVRSLTALPWAAALDGPQVSRVTGALELGERMTVRVVMTGSEAGAASGAAARLLTLMRNGRQFGAPVAELLRNLSDRTTVTYPDGRSADVAVIWEREEVDEAASMVARAVGQGFGP